MPFFVSGGGSTSFNALGSNIVLTDDNQKVLVRYEYDIFGAIRSETGTCNNTRKFTGKEFDADSNLYYYGARYYDPYIGRFTQRDPAGDGVNWYTYVANNPLKFVDPTGTTIVLLGPQDSSGNSTVEVTMSQSGTTFHGGSVSTLSRAASILYQSINGTGTINNTAHPALKDTTTAGKMVTNLINSDKTVYVVFDSSMDKSMSGEADFMSPTSDNEIMVRINAKYATGKYGGYLDSRITLVHELTHAEQAINDPNEFRNRSYYNVYSYEYQAYDRGARFAAELQGDYITKLGYVPRYFLEKQRFNPDSFTYRSFIHMAARTSAKRFGP